MRRIEIGELLNSVPIADMIKENWTSKGLVMALDKNTLSLIEKQICEAFKIPAAVFANIDCEEQYQAFINNMVGDKVG